MSMSVPSGAAWKRVRRFVSELPAAGGAGQIPQVTIKFGAERKPSLEVCDDLGNNRKEGCQQEKQHHNPEDSVGQVDPEVLWIAHSPSIGPGKPGSNCIVRLFLTRVKGLNIFDFKRSAS